MTAQKRSMAEARRSDDGQENVEWVHNAHDDRSSTRKHSEALHDKRGYLVVRHARPTYDPLTTEKATTMELQRHHDGDELVVLNEHSSSL